VRLFEDRHNVASDLLGPEGQVDGTDHVGEVDVGRTALEHTEVVAAGCKWGGVHVAQPRPEPLAVVLELRKRPALLFVEAEYVTQVPPQAAGALDGNTCEARRGTAGTEPEFVLGVVPWCVAVEPFHEGEVLNVAEIAHSDEPYRNQEGAPSFRLRVTTLLVVLTASTAHTAVFEEGEQFHAAAVVAVLPARKANKWHILVSEVGAAIWVAVVRWHPEMRHTEAVLEAFFAN
jgi:hypothetical protein